MYTLLPLLFGKVISLGQRRKTKKIMKSTCIPSKDSGINLKGQREYRSLRMQTATRKYDILETSGSCVHEFSVYNSTKPVQAQDKLNPREVRHMTPPQTIELLVNINRETERSVAPTMSTTLKQKATFLRIFVQHKSVLKDFCKLRRKLGWLKKRESE